MKNSSPAARRAGGDIFRAVVNIKNFRAASSRQAFQSLVNGRVRLQSLDFVGKNVAVEILEEGKIPADVLDGQVVRVGKNVGLESAPPQFRVQFNHRRNFRENVGKHAAKFVDVAEKAGGVLDLIEKFPSADQAGFKFDQRRRTAQEGVKISRRLRAARGHPARGDGIIEIHQHLAEIKDNDRLIHI